MTKKDEFSFQIMIFHFHVAIFQQRILFSQLFLCCIVYTVACLSFTFSRGVASLFSTLNIICLFFLNNIITYIHCKITLIIIKEKMVDLQKKKVINWGIVLYIIISYCAYRRLLNFFRIHFQ